MRIPIRDYDFDLAHALQLVGLQRRRSSLGLIASGLGLLAAGAAIGAGIGLAFAPSSGRRFREDMGGRFDQIKDKVKRESERYGSMNTTSPHSS